ncbi:CDP-alcohol phosphatidyltransferase-domain containing protein [Nitzschia inconspicua]|uniref:CDP-alcohol phosphatidyltransferase-domain containing protein n=1 Tax=Nitzschia inconspicua TaxID=303405 RepID=A0A9K3LET4_9STRA|nr:CDP-alcohol phosphatidyltransferase-domain containing protein [Nitzschia inconspicua]
MTSQTTSSPKDQHKMHVWLIEPTASKNSATTAMDGVLTPDGCEQIAQHKYKAGSYTSLDTFLNPGWTQLTEFLPLWLAPNLVTTIGGCFCLISYVLSVYFLNHQDDNHDSSDNPIPRWLYFWNAFALCAYYTLDCMDGKQARRTNSSSPLGQLFDHGIDALGNVSHVQAIQCIVQLPPVLLVTLQCSLQTAFFQAQWEEYYTGSLPHATGNVGVTEVTYGMALWSLVTGLFGREIYEQRVVTLSDANDSNFVQSLLLWWTGGLHELQVRHVAAIMWVFLIIGLTTLSYIRVYEHVGGDIKVFFSAVSKLALGPWLLSYVGVVINQQSTLALGLAFCLITIKIIVFSMARMAFASLQMAIFPFLTASLWLRYAQHDWLTSGMKQQLEWALDVFYLAAISFWANRAISQLCEKLHIKLFRIDVKKKNS